MSQTIVTYAVYINIGMITLNDCILYFAVTAKHVY